MTDAPATRFAKDRLRAFVERIEVVETEIRDRNEDKRDIYAEAKGQGYDVKALKTVIAYRRKDQSERIELDAIVDTYMVALGMVPATRVHAHEGDMKGSGGSEPPSTGSASPPVAPPTAASAASPDGLDIPPFLKRERSGGLHA